jgi:hypothetical protein
MSDNQTVDAVEQVPSTEDRLAGRILRTLYGKDYQPEGRLANFVHDKMTSPTWRSCVSRLIESGLISVSPVYYFGNARRIGLTERGRERAKSLTEGGGRS